MSDIHLFTAETQSSMETPMVTLQNSVVIARDPKTGKQRWRRALGSHFIKQEDVLQQAKIKVGEHNVRVITSRKEIVLDTARGYIKHIFCGPVFQTPPSQLSRDELDELRNLLDFDE